MAKLSFEEFKSYTESEFKENYDISFLKKVDRETGNILTGVVISLKRDPTGIVLTLNDYYKDVQIDNRNLKEITGKIKKDFREIIKKMDGVLKGSPGIAKYDFTNWADMKPLVRIDFNTPRIVNEDLCLNTALKKVCSYYLDLDLLEGHKYQMPITNKMAESWGVGKDELFMVGIENINPKVELDEEKEDPSLEEVEEKFKLPYPIMMIKGKNPVSSMGLLFTKNVKNLLEKAVKNNCYMIPISDLGLIIVGRSSRLEKEVSLEDLQKIISVYTETGKEKNIAEEKNEFPPVIEFFAEPQIFVLEGKAFSIKDFEEVKDFDKEKELEKNKKEFYAGKDFDKNERRK